MSVLAAPTLLGNTGGMGDLMQMGGGIQMWAVPFKVPGSASYATGGDTFTPPPGAPASWQLMMVLVVESQATYNIVWTGGPATPKIQFFTQAGGAEVANATNLSAVTIYGLAFYTS